MMKLFQNIQIINQSINLSLELRTNFSYQIEKTLLESIDSDLNHLGVGKVDDHS